jgi:L,D-transpeptidase ErfK/SrfK
MRRAGKPVVSRVPPSPENPLGEYWIGLNLPGIGIHGTNAPSSIYRLVTHGCIRLHPEDVQGLFTEVDVGMSVRIIYEPVLMTKVENTVYLEVHPDVYKTAPDPFRMAVYLASTGGFLDMLDLARVEEVIRKHDGIARDVTSR